MKGCGHPYPSPLVLSLLPLHREGTGPAVQSKEEVLVQPWDQSSPGDGAAKGKNKQELKAVMKKVVISPWKR